VKSVERPRGQTGWLEKSGGLNPRESSDTATKGVGAANTCGRIGDIVSIVGTLSKRKNTYPGCGGKVIFEIFEIRIFLKSPPPGHIQPQTATGQVRLVSAGGGWPTVQIIGFSGVLATSIRLRGAITR
jgi:hypothetical protein